MHIPKIKGKLVLVFVCLGLVITSCAELKKERILKLAHGLPTDHPVHEAMVFMGERVKELSGGNLQLEIYPGAQLGSEQECVELLQIGSLDMTKVSVGVMENFAPKLKVFGLPFLFENIAVKSTRVVK